MKYRQIGNSGLRVSEISIGSWLTYGMGVNRKIAFKCLDTALKNNINFIDTADVYNKGMSEKIIGEFIKKIKREDIIIGTKVFGPMSNNWMTQGLSHRHIINACNGSLDRLQTEYIDLYQCHRFDIDTPLEETCYAMHLLIERGYINHWGVSQWSAVQITNAVRICEKNGWRKPVSNQPVYNMLNRSLEVDVMDVCEKEGLGLIVYSPLAQGLLTGKYIDGKIPQKSRAKHKQMGFMFPFKRMNEDYFKKQDKLLKISDKLKIKLSQLALAWALFKKPLSSVIIGATSAIQINENCKSVNVKLNDEIMSSIESILQNAPLDQYTESRIGYGIIKRGY